ncbi:M23 family metallopeptidase [Paeniglutamicibacter psychrophenolicus]|uniref:M23 family metallopeptidase n=1 Tax=Paeniglutamicibacter psychrophenolicus TaxID=257454 RepID=UPI00277F9CC5|nr:M23 family metallopeptidase [Paeniglutamicibacter psychrophenolicus]MDQ0093807.1 outer membrane biosynthesis protein TonB [Paeniglutamicibacter psychrophenolicus]
MKKHHVNHPLPLPKPFKVRRQPEAAKAAAVGIAVVAALAVSNTPSLAGRQIGAVPVVFAPLQVDEASFSRPVEVGLFGGADAIRWESENITSAAAGVKVADASDPEALPGLSGASAQLVGQNVGPLGVLPAGIQLIHPVSSRHITSPYGWRNNPTGAGTQIHIGQDYAIACGSPVYASADGTVIQSAWAGHSGMRVTIDHGSSVRTGYSHNSTLVAKVGDVVKQGQLIALSGTTGNSTGCHVHFEVIINGRWNDPRNFLPLIPGQPNPMVDSRRTTIAAEPIRNPGEPRSESENGHDIDVPMPEPTKPAPSTKAPEKETASPQPSEETKPSEATKPGKTPTPNPTPDTSPEPSATPTPDASPTPTPTPEPSEETTPPPSSSPTSSTPTDSTPVEPTDSPSSASTGSQSSMPTTSSSSAPTESASTLSDSGFGAPSTKSSSGAGTTGDGTAATLSSSPTAAQPS